MDRIKLVAYWLWDQLIFPLVSAFMPYAAHYNRAVRQVEREGK